MSRPRARLVLLVGWDSADWQVLGPLLDAGAMPALTRLVEQGVMGGLATLEPTLCPLLWTSVATGRRADAHGVLGLVEPDASTGWVRLAGSRSRLVPALWNMLGAEGLGSIVVGWPATHPAETVTGAVVSDFFPRATVALGRVWPMAPGAVSPPQHAEALSRLRVHPGEIALDDVLPFVPRAREIDQAADPRLAAVARALAEAASVQAAATWLMEREPWEFAAVHVRLLAALCQQFMRYRPPAMPGVAERDAGLYAGVVDAGCRFLDLMLARLVALAGPEAAVIVCSDHGFSAGALRPAVPADPETWHRSEGVFVMSGPGVSADERVWGATVLDVAPAILRLLGVAPGVDLEGRVLAGVFVEPAPRAEPSPSSDAAPATPVPAEPREDADPAESEEMARQLALLGFVDLPGTEREAAARHVARTRRLNLARVHLGAERSQDAAALLELLLAERTDDRYVALLLARARYALGDLAGCRRLVEPLLAPGDPPALALALSGALLAAEGRTGAALERLSAAESAAPGIARLQVEVGTLYLQLGRAADAERALRRAVAADPTSAAAWDGLAAACLGIGRPREAADAALSAVRLRHDAPRAHLSLGVALAGLGELDRAARAFETALDLDPASAPAHLGLAAVLERAGDLGRAAVHRRAARELVERRRSPDTRDR